MEVALSIETVEADSSNVTCRLIVVSSHVDLESVLRSRIYPRDWHRSIAGDACKTGENISRPKAIPDFTTHDPCVFSMESH
jgi:hypothetical protein